jgi:hypothetical protein
MRRGANGEGRAVTWRMLSAKTGAPLAIEMEGEFNMQLRSRGAGSPVVTSLVEWLAHGIRSFQEARIRRRERSDNFHRNLSNDCRAPNVSPMREDDWKTRRESGQRQFNIFNT